MEKSIEAIWKEGFLNEKSLVAPKINDLYNQKSMHLVDKMIRMFRANLTVIIITAIVFPVIHYFLDVLWQGMAASVLLLLTAWYNKRQIDSIKTLDQGTTSLDYLKSLDRWLKEVLLKSEKIARFSYPLYILIAISTIWSAWEKQGLTLKIHQKFPNLIAIGDLQVFAIIIAGATVLLMFLFAAKIYKWEVRLMYGRVFGKLAETITEMENLKH
ncbi:hypothetical protein [Dyadobacter pollutisoli]|jgi:hypothetical protein|uniref:Uncharacterized protein n=1 Tax=Dyadobacter pollutisoli TaxID=2910158 RepID=A0A9E8N754_9BACT|nr:hypothetical protein [Dyadobacter pollutisoli]WAC10598.1 hypothetical protein ON006_22985 [Dyadobacter pollutisoli]